MTIFADALLIHSSVNMDLKDFISQTLCEIVSGTRDASEKLKDEIAVCAHTSGEYSGYPSVSYVSGMKTRKAPLTVVNFKVQVCVEERLTADGSAKASILNVAGASVSGEGSTADSLLQEVSFSIPISWKG